MEKTTKTTIIAIANQKGGVGKTTTTVNIAAALVTMGKKVLCIDYDPQSNMGKYLGHAPDGNPTITDFILAYATYMPLPPAEGLIRHTSFGIDYIPSSLRLSRAENALAQRMCREQALREILPGIVQDVYDFILIDCPPSMGILLTNAMTAADRVLIPVQTEEFSIDGLADMMELIAMIKANINPGLEIAGLLPTMTDSSAGCRDILELLHSEYADLVFTGSIGDYKAAPKSVKARKPVIGTKTKLAAQYMTAAVELLERSAQKEH